MKPRMTDVSQVSLSIYLNVSIAFWCFWQQTGVSLRATTGHMPSDHFKITKET